MSTNENHTDESDPLSALLMDGAEVDRARIAATIGELVGIDSTTKVVRPRGPAYRGLSNKEKILAIMLGLKAATLMGIRGSEAIRSSELPGMTGVTEGSVYPTLKILREEHMVSQTQDGEYYLSEADVLGAIEVLERRAGEVDGGTIRQSVRPRKSSRPKDRPDEQKPTADDEGNGSREKKAGPKKASSGFSQTEKVREMIAAGWFDEPRTLGDVQREIRHTTAHQVPLGNLSPVFVRLVRSGALTRGLDEDGNYQYRSK